MKLSKLIYILKEYEKRHPDEDAEVRFIVKDHYSNLGEWAKQVDVDLDSGVWPGIFYNNSNLTLTVHLNDKESKHPKITFRK